MASVSVGLGSKERPRNGTGTVFYPHEIGARVIFFVAIFFAPEPHGNACYVLGYILIKFVLL